MTGHRLLGSVYGKRLRDNRRALAGWAAGIGLLLALYIVSFPPIQENAEDIDRVVASYPPEVRALMGDTSLGDPAGYLNAEYFQTTAPLLFLIFGIRRGAQAVAGEEDRGTLELLLSTPVRRGRAVLEPWLSLATLLALLALFQFVVIAAAGPAFGLTVGLGRLGAASLSLFLLATLFTTLALAAGAATGRPGVAVAAATALAVVSFLVESFSGLVSWMEPLAPASPWAWYAANDPLRHGVLVEHVAAFAALTGALLALALWAFDRRDVGA